MQFHMMVSIELPVDGSHSEFIDDLFACVVEVSFFPQHRSADPVKMLPRAAKSRRIGMMVPFDTYHLKYLRAARKRRRPNSNEDDNNALRPATKTRVFCIHLNGLNQNPSESALSPLACSNPLRDLPDE
jgi:hypothetical protein